MAIRQKAVLKCLTILFCYPVDLFTHPLLPL
jgi:hypothetical protein